MNPVLVPNAEWLAWLAALTAASAPLNGAKLHLYKVLVALSGNTALGDLTECDFTGYAASSAITWGTPFFKPDGTAVVTGDLKSFVVGSSPTVLNTVYGWYVTQATPTSLLLARQFDTPVILTQAAQGIEVIPCYPTYLSQ